MKKLIALILLTLTLNAAADTNIVITLTDAEFAQLPTLTTNNVQPRLIAQAIVKRTLKEKREADEKKRMAAALAKLRASTNETLKASILQQIESE